MRLSQGRYNEKQCADCYWGGRNYGLDILRVGMAFLIFMFHSQMHFGCGYSVLNAFVSMGAISMTGFFLLSGYVLQMTNEKTDFSRLQSITKFYIKRLIGIVPLYYLTALIYLLFIDSQSWEKKLMLLPIDILGIQEFFSPIMDISHYSGTWFISCMLLAYFVFPYMSNIIKQMTNRARLRMMFLLSVILLYSPIVKIVFELNGIYDNPFFRIIEMTIGVLLFQIQQSSVGHKLMQKLHNPLLPPILLLFMIVAVSLAIKFRVPFDFMLYSFIALPVFALLILTLSQTEFSHKSNILMFYSSVSYELFLVQSFLWPLSSVAVQTLGSDSNFVRIIVSFFLCTILASVMHYVYQKPIANKLKTNCYNLFS